jgi:hypothetical protein
MARGDNQARMKASDEEIRTVTLFIPEDSDVTSNLSENEMVVTVASFAELAKTVEECLEEAEGGKHRAYHLIMEFHKRGVDLFVRKPPTIFESSSDLGHGD